jgi:thiosulfate dehydrogenase
MIAQHKMFRRLATPLASAALLGAMSGAFARDPFTPAELKAMDEKLTASVQRGFDIWHGGKPETSNNGLACANCHPDAAATNPQTFPKFMPTFNKVVPYREMVNWCIANPQGGQKLDVNGEDMTAMEAYSFYLYKGRPIETGLQTRQTASITPTTARGFNVKGTGIGFDK